MATVVNKVRRGDVVAVEIEHSGHHLNKGRVSHTTVHLAEVDAADRSGRVTFIRLAPGYSRISSDHAARVLTITGDNQKMARQAFGRLSREANEFADFDMLRSHLMALGAVDRRTKVEA